MIINLDCLLGMRTCLADNSIDAVVTDPPYGLSKEPDMMEVMKHWMNGDDYVHTGGGFMGKSWDSFVPGPSIWKEVFRVLKPGGHLLAFFGSRTYDLGTLAIRLAGFEIRDQIMWVYGSGFPKSLDVSKAIDKARTEDVEPTREICRFIRAGMDTKGIKSKDLTEYFGNCNARLIDHWAARDTDSQPNLPTKGQFNTLKKVLDLSNEKDALFAYLDQRKGQNGDAYSNAAVIGEHTGVTPGFVGERFSATDKTIREHTCTAKQWSGWGTALKPAHEPICVARKPLSGTVAENVLTHSTGALNIDGCRIGDEIRFNAPAGNKPGGNSYNMSAVGMPQDAEGSSVTGRWPANFVHDGLNAEEWSRFFYCAKASKSDRDDGVSLAATSAAEMVDRDADSAGMNSPRAGAGRTSGARNDHPTVKPTALMQWLVRLVTPPGGTVLDPFTGSGSTGKACMLEGFEFIGFEMDPHYCEIAEQRIAKART